MRRSTLTLPQAKDPVLAVGDLTLDEDSLRGRPRRQPVQLTATEFELLRFLMRNPRRVLSKAQILDRVWSTTSAAGDGRRALHLLPAQEDRRRPRADDPHRARRRLHAEGRRMTKPGDPGHAAASRARRRRTRPTRCRARDASRRRRPWTLHRRLLAIVARLLIAVSAVIGVASVAVFHDVVRRPARRVAARDRLAGERGRAARPARRPAAGVVEFLRVPGQPAGTLGRDHPRRRRRRPLHPADGQLPEPRPRRRRGARRACPPTASRTPSTSVASATTARSPCRPRRRRADRARAAAGRGQRPDDPARRHDLGRRAARPRARARHRRGRGPPRPAARSPQVTATARASRELPLERGDGRARRAGPRSTTDGHRGGPARRGAQPHARPRRHPPCPRASRASRRCGSSSPTRATSCERRSPRSAGTPS